MVEMLDSPPTPPVEYEDFCEVYSGDERDLAALAAIGAKYDMNLEPLAQEYSENYDLSEEDLLEELQEKERDVKIYDIIGMENLLALREYGAEQLGVKLDGEGVEFPPLDVNVTQENSLVAGRDTHEVLRKADERGYDREKVAEEINYVKEQNDLFDELVNEDEERGRRKQGLVTIDVWSIEEDLDIVSDLMREIATERGLEPRSF